MNARSPRPVGEGGIASRLRAFPWADTPLGAREAWPAALRFSVELVMRSRQPMAVLWGPSFVQICNDAFEAMVGEDRGSPLGRSAPEMWADIWPAIGPEIESAMSGRDGVLREAHRISFPRHGGEQELWWTYSHTPIVDPDAPEAPGGVLVVVMEATETVRAQARLEQLAAALERLARVDAAEGALRIVAETAERLAGADVAALAEVDGARALVAAGAEGAAGALDERRRAALRRLCARAVAERATVVVGDLSREAEGEPQAGAAVAVPVGGARPYAAIAVGWAAPREARPEEIAAIEALARAAAGSILRGDSDRRLRQSEERFRSIAQLSPQALVVVLDGVIVFSNAAAIALLGAGDAGDLVGLPLEEILDDPELRARTRERLERVLRGETLPPREQRWRRLDGSIVEVEVSAGPVDWNGRAAVQAVGRDVTERKRSAEALAASEARFRQSEWRLRQLIENLPQLVWRSRDGGDWTWSSPQWTALTGLTREESLGFGWMDAIHPDDRSRVRDAWAEAGATGALSVEHRLRVGGSDGWRWFQTRAKALVDDRGAALEWFGTSTDVDDLRRLQEHQKVLMSELQHRVRNTLSIVRSIARRTSETAETVADFEAHFEGRLNAFARTQSHVTRDPSGGVALEYLVAEELTSCAAREGARIKIGGPKVLLRPKAAETLTLAIHELATNAVKYGALATRAGTIEVSWTVDRTREPPRLGLVWQESGVSIDPWTARRPGFGTELLERTLPYELEAEVDLAFGPDGVRCAIDVPLTRRVAA